MDTNKLISLLSELATLVKVVELGTFSQAAKNLGVAPSSISRSISRLEQAVGEKLLERTTRKMRLTPTGQQVFLLSRDMLASAKMAVSAAQSDNSDISGVLRIAAPKALSRQLLMPVIFNFVRDYPKVSFHLKAQDETIDFVTDEVDVLIQITEKPIEGLISKSLGVCQSVLCASPAYLAAHGVPNHPSDLEDHQCLPLGEYPKDNIWHFTSAEQHVSATVQGPLMVNHSEIRREAVLQGMGVSVFAEFVVAPLIKSGQLVALLDDWDMAGNYQGEIVIQYPQSKYIPSQVKQFIDYLQQSFKES